MRGLFRSTAQFGITTAPAVVMLAVPALGLVDASNGWLWMAAGGAWFAVSLVVLAVARRRSNDANHAGPRSMIATDGSINAYHSTVNVTFTTPLANTGDPVNEGEPQAPTPDEVKKRLDAGEPFILQRADGTLAIPRVIKNHTFRLSEIPLGANVIQGQEFEDCIVYGPVAVVLAGSTKFEECLWEATVSEDSILWEMPEGKALDGVLQLRDCIFRRCTFRQVAIAGARSTLDNFQRATQSFAMPPASRGRPPGSHDIHQR